MITDIEFNQNDYWISGKPLQRRITQHEVIDAGDFIPAILGQPGTIKRLLAESEPDLINGFTALYVCSMCGGYDGGSIGAKIIVDDHSVSWSQLGYYHDDEGGNAIPFSKVTEFKFERNAYENFIAQSKLYEIT